MIYKLSFTSKNSWDAVKGELILKDEQGNYPSGSIYTAQTELGTVTICEVGHIPIEAVYDDEGVIVSEATAHEDFAVDINADFELPITKYSIQEEKQWYNEWA